MNVVLVTVDCLRQDRCGIYGHHRDTTPTLDSLGRKGFVFDNAYATGPVTTESFPGILAGRLSADCIAADNLYQKRLPDGEPTVASHLRDGGWSTAAVITNPRIGPHVASDRGFETFENLRQPSGNSTDDNSGSTSIVPDLDVGHRLYRLRERMRELDGIPFRYELPFLAYRSYQYLSEWPSVRGERVVDGSLDTLDDLTGPFFAWTHLMDVHGPIHPQTALDGGFTDRGRLSQFRSHARRVSNAPDAQTGLRYDSAVRYVDAQIARIVDQLKSSGRWDETILVVTADHGEALHDRGVYAHPQHYTYDELLNVPLVVRVPEHDGRRVDTPFSLGWIHELLADLTDAPALDAPLSSPYEGKLPIEEPSGDTQATLLADSISPRGHSVVVRRGSTKHVVQTHELTDATSPDVQPTGTYHLCRDPKERIRADAVNSELRQRAEDLVTAPDELRAGTDDDSSVTEATKDRLRQLGYAE